MAIFAKPSEVHTDASEEGIDLNIYYAAIPYQEEIVHIKDEYEEYDECYHEYSGFDYDAVDKEFYQQHGIFIKQLELLGLVTTPIEDGNR